MKSQFSHQWNWLKQNQEKLLYVLINPLSITMSSISNPTKIMLNTIKMDNTTKCIISLNVAAVFIVLAIETSKWEVGIPSLDVMENTVVDNFVDTNGWEEIISDWTVKLIITAK